MIEKEINFLQERYKKFQNMSLKIDMTRGKPSYRQLDLSDSLVNNISVEDIKKSTDYRNYSTPQFLTGLHEAKILFSNMTNVKPENIIIGGNSSLNLMYDTLAKLLLLKLPNQDKSWFEQGQVKFLCPTPGYDRHFSMCESLGIQMISVPLTGEGPEMNLVEKMVLSDPMIKGIWCVPKYSNPTGEIYSDQTIKRLSSMKTLAKDFIILWDNAYAIHDFYPDNPSKILDIIEECYDQGNDTRVFAYASTSKITYAGGGISAIISNKILLEWYKQSLKFQTIGFDKINQVRHIKLFPEKQSLINHMKDHAAILKPKFDLISTIFRRELGDRNIYGEWNNPRGGYFVNFNTKPGIATQVVKMAKESGLKISAAGCTFPYGIDPEDKNLRISPSLLEIEDIKLSTELLSTILKILTIKNKSSEYK